MDFRDGCNWCTAEVRNRPRAVIRRLGIVLIGAAPMKSGHQRHDIHAIAGKDGDMGMILENRRSGLCGFSLDH